MTTIIIDPDVLPSSESGFIQMDGERYRIVDHNYKDDIGNGVLLVRCLTDKTKANRERQMFLVPADLPAWIQAGDVVCYHADLWLVDSISYQTPYGTFVALAPLEDTDIFREVERGWQRIYGIFPHRDHPYEIIKSLCVQDKRGHLQVAGYLVRNRQSGSEMALSIRETWALVYREGAVNAYAMKSKRGIFQSSLLDSADGLPHFESKYWQTEVLDELGVPKYNLSAMLQRDINRFIPKNR